MSVIVLHQRWALGDTVLATALVRDFRAAYGKAYQLITSGHYRSVWTNNPHLDDVKTTKDTRQVVTLEYEQGVTNSHSGTSPHFLAWLYKDFEKKTGLRVPVLQPKGEIFLSEAEKQPIVDGKYWVVIAGHKTDMSTKQWPWRRYQVVVDTLLGHGIRFVQAGSKASHHVHPELRNVLNLVGKTENPRDFFTLIQHADGVLCGITAAMHVAAVFDKPCVVLAGGRELPAWEAYTNAYKAFGPECAPVKVEHRYLHTMGRLECCKLAGCWRRWTVPPTDRRFVGRYKGQALDRRLCLSPVKVATETAPECMSLITADQVVNAVLSYGDTSVLRQPALPSLITTPAEPSPSPPEPFGCEMLKHPLLGGKITVCVLCYGDHANLAKRCLDSVLRSVPLSQLDLRIAMNECCAETRSYVYGLPSTTIYDNDKNLLKYPVMRKMFRDKRHPITTPYLVWFDDDSYVVDNNWLETLSRTIIAHHDLGYRMYGAVFLHDLARYARRGHRPEAWFKAARWWRNKPLYVGKTEQTAPNGSVIRFCSGAFWAIHTPAIQEADIPDERLKHNGGDVLCGANLIQAGYKCSAFNTKKEHIFSSGAPRRGFREDFPWARPRS